MCLHEVMGARRSAVRNRREASSTARPLEYGRIAFENVLGDIVPFLSAELRMFAWPQANFAVTRWPPDLFSPVKAEISLEKPQGAGKNFWRSARVVPPVGRGTAADCGRFGARG